MFTVFTDKFHILCISSNWQWLQWFPIKLKVVIMQGFSFICFRTDISFRTLISVFIFVNHLHIWTESLYNCVQSKWLQ